MKHECEECRNIRKACRMHHVERRCTAPWLKPGEDEPSGRVPCEDMNTDGYCVYFRPKTICVDCAHSLEWRRRHGSKWLCYAPWQKTTDLVTGRLVPSYVKCGDTNHGDCKHFTPKPPSLLLPIWNFLNSE
jgi:hypothetical protein